MHDMTTFAAVVLALFVTCVLLRLVGVKTL